MTPKEKAEDLLRIFYNQMSMPLDCEWNDSCYNKFKDRNGLAKACALIAVDEILDSYQKETKHGYIISDKIVPYWQEVKNHIQEL